jgi:hypothetical protein
MTLVERISVIAVLVAYFALPPALTLGIAIREVCWTDIRARRWFGGLTIVVNLIIVAAPVTAVLFSFVGSPVAQLNDPNPRGINWWSVWRHTLHPALVNGLTACMIVAAIMVLFALGQMIVRSSSWWLCLTMAALTVLHAALQLLFIFRLAPTA